MKDTAFTILTLCLHLCKNTDLGEKFYEDLAYINSLFLLQKYEECVSEGAPLLFKYNQ